MKNFDKRKNYIIVLDIETANFVHDPIAYDVGFVVADTKGNIYERFSYMVEELFIDHKELLRTAYYSEKIARYWKDYAQGKRRIRSILEIRKILAKVMRKYGITEIFAYNAFFDTNGLDNTIRFLTKSKVRSFFPHDTKFSCIWNIACQTIYTQKGYQKLTREKGWISEVGNIRTSAEIGYRYVSNDFDFIETHTGLEDVEIEYKILIHGLKQRKKLNKQIDRMCWKIPQNV